jgi:cation:H+ antiporter
MIHFAGFIGCAAVIFFAGQRLSFYGDLLAEKTGMGKAWIGLILMASVTSLPELMVGISSSAIVQDADLAVGDIMGSCAFNLGILAMMDAYVPRANGILRVASKNHILAAALGLILVALVGLGLFLPQEIQLLSFIGITSISFIIVYLFSIRLIYRHEMNNSQAKPTDASAHDDDRLSLRQVVLRYALFALVIVAAALALPYFAEHIAEQTGLGKSFVGTLFLAVSTSLPEIAVSIAAVRIGSIDLSVGNLLGSNLFNVFILAIDDMFYTKGNLLKDASDVNILSVFSTLIMTAVVIIGLAITTLGKRYRMAWDSVLIFLIYFFNLVLLFRFSKT